MLDELKPGFGFRGLDRKGHPARLGHGWLGGLGRGRGRRGQAPCSTSRLPPEQLLKFALAGEAVASGAAHADNIAPCLYGGLTLALSLEPLRIVSIPTPPGLECVLVHPHIKLETRHARAILKPTLLLQEHVHQSAHLAAFISACHRGDLELLSGSMIDLVIEPQRAELIPGFYEAKSAAIAQGALGFSISGSGPSVFAWTRLQERLRTRPRGDRAGVRRPQNRRRLLGRARARRGSPSHPMRYLSTRTPETPLHSLGSAIEQGLAPDGGLYVPEAFPRPRREELRRAGLAPGDRRQAARALFRGRCARLLAPADRAPRP